MAKKEIKYSDAISEIEDIIHEIENDELDIDDLSEKIKKVSALIKICKNKLYQTEAEIQNILNDINED